MSSVPEDLFPDTRNPDGTSVLNDRCVVQTRDGSRAVTVAGLPLFHYAVTDRMSEAHAMVSLIDQGWADQNDVARVFGCSVRTVRRNQRRFEEQGLRALGHGRGFPRGQSRLGSARQRVVQDLKVHGHSNCEIGRRLGISEKAVRKTLRRLGWKPASAVQDELPLRAPHTPDSCPAPGATSDPKLSALAAAAPESPPLRNVDRDPTDRRGDRLLARLGLLEDAAPLFGSSANVPRAGVLLAVPALVASGLFDCAQKIYGSLGPAFFGLRTTLVTLLFMALWRIKRPEGLKEHAPADLGRVLGLDRAPEVKTLRRKLARLAATQRATQFGQALVRQRIAQHGEALGFLYLDGHVRVYHGQHRLPKAHVARMRLSMPATTDYWVNDTEGDPLFVVTAEVNAGLVTVFPSLLQELRGLLGSRRVTFVFDRGGYSPKLFRQILAAGFDLLTYRKGRCPRIPRKAFRSHSRVVEGRTIAYVLADQEVRLLKGKLRLRQVTRLMDNGHRTAILTSRRDLPAVLVAYRMFERWRQENFFKYLRQEFDLDALVEHAVEPDDPTRDVPNPAWAKVDAQRRQAYARLDRLQAEYGLEAFTNLEKQRRTMRGFKIAQGKLGRQILDAWHRVEALETRREKVPRRVPVGSLSQEPVVKLAPEIQHLTNLLKMVAYQTESELLRQLSPHYPRARDEGRTLLQSAFLGAADLQVTDKELHVTLAPLSSPHRSRAIAALCDELNKTNTTFPGSSLRVRYAVRLAATAA
jgi:prepilin-type processing-associated H-X9-DG protein